MPFWVVSSLRLWQGDAACSSSDFESDLNYFDNSRRSSDHRHAGFVNCLELNLGLKDLPTSRLSDSPSSLVNY